MSKIKKNSININSVKREICKVYVPLALFFLLFVEKIVMLYGLGFLYAFFCLFFDFL
jgi:hypothetical protein